MHSTTTHRCRSWILAVGVVLLGGLPARGSSQEIPVPADGQIAMLELLWKYDRAHESRTRDGLVVGIVYQRRSPPSARARQAFEAAAAHLAAGGRPVQLVAIDYGDAASLGRTLRDHGIDIAYVTPLHGVDVVEVAYVTRSAGVLSCTGVPEYVDRGIAVGIELREGRRAIVVNRSAAHAEGARLSSEVLNLARLVGGRP